MMFSLRITSFSKKNLKRILFELNKQKLLLKNKLFMKNTYFKITQNRYTLLTSINGDKNTAKSTLENCTYSHIIFIYIKNLQNFLYLLKTIKTTGTTVQISNLFEQK